MTIAPPRIYTDLELIFKITFGEDLTPAEDWMYMHSDNRAIHHFKHYFTRERLTVIATMPEDSVFDIITLD